MGRRGGVRETSLGLGLLLVLRLDQLKPKRPQHRRHCQRCQKQGLFGRKLWPRKPLPWHLVVGNLLQATSNFPSTPFMKMVSLPHASHLTSLHTLLRAALAHFLERWALRHICASGVAHDRVLRRHDANAKGSWRCSGLKARLRSQNDRPSAPGLLSPLQMTKCLPSVLPGPANEKQPRLKGLSMLAAETGEDPFSLKTPSFLN